MSDTSRVQWTIVPRVVPQPWLNCNRCGGPKPFRSSGKIRVNANGKRLDAWLIYKCTVCDSTWNRPILERRPVQAALALRENESALVHRLEFDIEGLRRHASRVEQFDDVMITRRVLSQAIAPVRRLEILCIVSQPTGLRLDRLLANELHLSRSQLRKLEKTGALVIDAGSRALSMPVRNGLRVVIDLAGSRP